MNGKIINAFGRKEGDPLPGDEKPTDTKNVCVASIALIKNFLERAEKGKVSFAGVMGLDENGMPIVAIANPEDENIQRLAMLRLAARELTLQVEDRVDDYTYPEPIEESDGV